MELEWLGYRIYPETGVIIGIKGHPIGKVSGGGYIRIQRNKIGWQAHRLVWEAVHGPIPDGLQINHINGIKSDNRISNLEVVSASENAKHSYRTGLQCKAGELNGRFAHGRYVGRVRK